MEKQRNAGSQTVERALEILVAIGASGLDGMTLAECSTRLSYSKATTHRILRALEVHGFVEADDDTGAYKLGMTNLRLGMDYLEHLELRRAALRTLRTLAEEAQETVHLGVLDEARVVYIEKVESQHAIRMFSRVGHTMPAYSTGVGKAILAFLPTDLVVHLLPASFEGFTATTITTRDALLVHLNETRALGYAIDDVENEEGIRCVGAPVFDHTGSVIAAISVAGPATRITLERLEELGRVTQQAALAVSERLGYRGLTVAAVT